MGHRDNKGTVDFLYFLTTICPIFITASILDHASNSFNKWPCLIFFLFKTDENIGRGITRDQGAAKYFYCHNMNLIWNYDEK